MNNSSLIFYSDEDVDYLLNNSMVFPDLFVNLYFNIIVIFILYNLIFLICIVGIVGNGMVIWLLGFCMKRNPFTTYVLNLAAADIGVLIVSSLGYIVVIRFLLGGGSSALGFYTYACAWALMYLADQLLLTVISVDRCVAVLFPLWHRCHRPPRLSGMVCASVWVLSIMIIGLDFFLAFENESNLLQPTVNVAVCTPIMAISTIILFVKICTKTQQRKRGKLLPVISLALFLFLLFGFPVNYCYILLTFFSKLNLIMLLIMVAFVCTVLNCSINPLIYFLVGRTKRGQSWQSMKAALQRIFKEEENCREQEGSQSETQF
ncbi:mas-related G-protein coupled receptor member H-like [Heteronotia binoei]|uniref:mas-related G-protein coupled receptor member H-like n=1 Tax=Heteronotia binoei TaxID=13085 RepID=UPI002930917D|nr:mas-related G-protein coupled receptor member H-like [Heteronotia binoei]